MSQPVQNLSKFQKIFGVISWQVTSLVGVDVSRGAEDTLAVHGTGRPSDKTPAPATCWLRHSSWEYWQQRLLHQRYKALT